MRKIFVFVLAGILLLSACGTADMGHENDEGVEAHDYWARSALKDGNSAAYMLLHNHSTEEDALVGASSDAASIVELHLSQMSADGVMQMIQQESIPLPADGELELKPGSYHIMFIGLKQDLNVGDEITLTLHFQHHEDITLTVPVMEAESMGGGMDGQMHMDAAPTP